MLPFTKRPGRGGEDGEVFTKDDLDDLAMTNEKPATAPPLSARPSAGRADDFGDDEVTNFIPSKSISALVQDARRPNTIPPPPASRRPPASIPPPPMSQRPGKFITQVSGADEDEDGRTVVRGAPKIVKRSVPPPASQPPSSMSPAAVIKATLESARAAKRANEGALMPPPPAELLEDSTDRLAADDPRLGLAKVSHSIPPPPQSQRPQLMGSAMGSPMQSPYTAPMGMQPMGVTELGAAMLAGMGPHSQPPPSSHGHGPMTGPPPPMHLAHAQTQHAYQSAPGSIPPPPQSYRPPSSAYPMAPASQSGNIGAMPAHFMVPHGVDPPGTSVTARHRTPGRPASAWAMALVAAGLFVGVGAVAVMQSNDSLMDTTASFVDPSRASTKPAAPAAQPAPEPVPQGVPTTAVAPTVVVPPAAHADQPTVIGASTPPPAAAPAPEPKPEAKPAVVAAAPAAAAPKTTWIAPTPKAQAPAAAAPAPAPAPKPAAKPAVAANDDPPAEKPTKPTKGSKPGKGDATDDETKKALEALQKAQLESSFDK